MKTLGLIGGCSAESTAIYYSEINALVRKRMPGHGAKLLLWSFDFDEIDECCRTGNWDGALIKFLKAANWLQDAGADALLICTNTMHRVADPLAACMSIPIIHIIDETAAALSKAGLRKPILLGTKFTMKEPFYKERLEKRGFEVFLPNPSEQESTHDVIYNDLIQGKTTGDGLQTLTRIIERLATTGADSVILGCTELGLLIQPGDVSLPTFDTAEIHICAALEFVFG